jgi:pimeloyl-ACP methyl ester carboxylesterase
VGPERVHRHGHSEGLGRDRPARRDQLPTLITSGRYDECTPALVEPLHGGIAGSEWVLFGESAHMPYLEERERYLQVVGDFLDRVEAREG